MKKLNYTCTRCGYNTHDRSCMRTHFYKKKKICQAIENDIELTAEIKEYILANRIYRIPKEDPKQMIFNQIINNNNTNNNINNFVANLDDVEKIQTHFQHMNICIKPLEQVVEERYKREIYLLQNGDGNSNLCMSREDFIDTVENIVKINHLDEFNFIFDKKLDQIKIYEEDGWNPRRVIPGIKIILKTLKEYYLDHYEKYLVSNMNYTRNKAQDISKYTEHLEEYYKYIVCLDFEPYVQDRSRNDILNLDGEDDDDYIFMEKYLDIYNNIKNKTKCADVTKTVNEIVTIIKYNYKSNIKQVNCKVIDLMKIDSDYRKNYEYFSKI